MSKRKVLTRLFISCSIFILAGCDNVSASDNQEIIKSQVLSNIDSTRTLGTALEHRQRCESFKWEDGADEQGRQTVTYTCDMSASATNSIWKREMTRFANGYASLIESAKRSIDQYNEACVANGSGPYCFKKEADNSKLKEGLSAAKKLAENETIKVKQVIIWSVLPDTERSVQLLSAKYYFDFNNGSPSWASQQGDNLLKDIYNNNENNNPIIGLIGYEAAKINCSYRADTAACNYLKW
ncbi:hypothetical protein H5J46_003377 [Escherichia coli]|uniref:hypothetical protein n=1 Tax=Escherichia coli TaxID=562 RepID=UPI0018B09268|nr:hypothetical protein [Escherichia coli]EGA2503257.1 hypothetical protein [Escherichia coli]QPJ22722.1 hypothetical protein H7994_00405 [Escherichia coli O150:H6]